MVDGQGGGALPERGEIGNREADVLHGGDAPAVVAAALPGTGAGTPHHHLVCVDCRKVVDLHDSGLDGLRVADAKGFEVRALKVQVEGICPECAARKKRQGASVNRTVTASR